MFRIITVSTGNICRSPMAEYMIRTALADATDLMARYGDHAEDEAASRADRSRDLGNVIHFCHWRQIERTIAMLRVDYAIGAVH